MLFYNFLVMLCSIMCSAAFSQQCKESIYSSYIHFGYSGPKTKLKGNLTRNLSKLDQKEHIQGTSLYQHVTIIVPIQSISLHDIIPNCNVVQTSTGSWIKYCYLKNLPFYIIKLNLQQGTKIKNVKNLFLIEF